ncbi:hypothetical protein, partial [Streptosporangium sp. NPDC049304]|uniref:hypothetical protein n=1 Tax=Streptosporangium sp. NPDC049304 TaxID=3154830 RepID=UPI00342BA755
RPQLRAVEIEDLDTGRRRIVECDTLVLPKLGNSLFLATLPNRGSLGSRKKLGAMVSGRGEGQDSSQVRDDRRCSRRWAARSSSR